MSQSLCKQQGAYAESALDHEIVLMELGKGDFFTLRGTAAVIWGLLDGTRNRDAIAAELRKSFDGPSGQVERELDIFLGDLRRAGFVA